MFDYYSTTSHSDAPRWCPVCMVPLNPFERNGVEMDYCPQCHGVWLDQGELDRLIRNAIQILPVEPTTAVQENALILESPVGTGNNRFSTGPAYILEADWSEEITVISTP